jgi:hypothetical protein
VTENVLGGGAGASASPRRARISKSVEIGAILLSLVGIGACALLLAWLAHPRAPDDARAAADCGALGRAAVACDRHAAAEPRPASRAFDCEVFGKGGRLCAERP